VILEPLECDSRSRETWDAKSYMCFEMNKCNFKGVQTCVQFLLVVVFMHKDLTWYENYKLGGPEVNWVVDVYFIELCARFPF